jgi:hypothetical protein
VSEEGHGSISEPNGGGGVEPEGASLFQCETKQAR